MSWNVPKLQTNWRNWLRMKTACAEFGIWRPGNYIHQPALTVKLWINTMLIDSGRKARTGINLSKISTPHIVQRTFLFSLAWPRIVTAIKLNYLHYPDFKVVPSFKTNSTCAFLKVNVIYNPLLCLARLTQSCSLPWDDRLFSAQIEYFDLAQLLSLNVNFVACHSYFTLGGT